MSEKDLLSLNQSEVIEILGERITIQDVFGINEEDLSGEFQVHPAHHAYFNYQLALAERELAATEDAKELVYAECDEYYREELIDEGVKITESQVKSRIIRDFSYGKALKKERDAQYKVSVLKKFVRSLEQKTSLLITAGNHAREEMKMTGMSIREKEQQDIVSEVKTNLRTLTMKRKQKQD